MAKSAKKSQTIPYITPWMVARYPSISTPDTEGKYAKGKFKTGGVLDESDIADARVKLLDAAKKFWPDVAPEDVHLPLKEFFDGALDSPDRKSAGWGLTLSSKFRPAVFDSMKKKLPEGVKVGAGSVFRVAAAIAPWQKPSEETIVEVIDGKRTKKIVKTVTYGVLLYLNDTQVKELVEGTGRAGDGSSFDEVEGGFEYDGSGDTDSFGDDATDL